MRSVRKATYVPAKGVPGLSNNNPTIYFVEFDQTTDDELKAAIEADGFDLVSYLFLQNGFRLPTAEFPDLILISLKGEQSGASACCRSFRSACPDTPICLLHQDLSEWEESIALELGADTVIRQPSDTRRVLSQIRALMRRQDIHHFPRLQLFPSSRTVKIDNQNIALTDAEFELLSFLAEYAGTVVSRDTISEHLRGLQYDGTNRIIDLRIARIRHKLGDSAHSPRFIRTVRGQGYMIMAEDF